MEEHLLALAGRDLVTLLHERGLMITTREPFPRVLVLDWEWVLQQRSPAACRAPESSE